MKGYKHRKAFIATQGPLDSTVSDFWRMMWEHKSRVLVMLGDLEESGEVPKTTVVLFVCIIISAN